MDVARKKDQIMRTKVCDTADSLLASMQNAAKLELAGLQNAGIEINFRKGKVEELSRGLDSKLQKMEKSIYSKKPGGLLWTSRGRALRSAKANKRVVLKLAGFVAVRPQPPCVES